MNFLGQVSNNRIIEVRPFSDLNSFFKELAESEEYTIKELRAMDGGTLIEFSAEKCSFPVEMVRWTQEEFRNSKQISIFKTELEEQIGIVKERMNSLTDKMKELEEIYENL